MPRITLDWQPDGAGRIARLAIAQGQPLRPMQIELLLVYEAGAHSVHTVRLGQAETVIVPEAAGRPAPLFAYANHGDYGYGLFLLDTGSRGYLLAHLAKLEYGPATGTAVDALWEEVREARIAPSEWIALALRELPGERDDVTVSGVLARLQMAFRWYLTDAQRDALAPQIETTLRAGMLDAPARSLRIHYAVDQRDRGHDRPAVQGFEMAEHQRSRRLAEALAVAARSTGPRDRPC